MVSVLSEWVRCPVCGNKTRLQIRADNLPSLLLFCRQGRVARLKPDLSGSQSDRNGKIFYTSFTSLSHMSRSTGIVAYDIVTVFIDSLIFSVIYYKSGNCVISIFSHILGNAISLIAVFVFF